MMRNDEKQKGIIMAKNGINTLKITVVKEPPTMAAMRDKTLYHCENLDILRNAPERSVDLIVTDPPFKADRNFYAANLDADESKSNFPDIWCWSPVEEKWLSALKKTNKLLALTIECIKETDKSMGAYISFMAIRLHYMEKVLKKDGSIYLHCDQTSSHYLKMVMDIIFGKNKFNSEITWKRHTSHNTKVFGNICDKILFYGPSVKNKDDVRIPLTEEYKKSFFKHEDERGVYSENSLTASASPQGSNDKESLKPWKGADNRGMPWAAPSTGEYAKWIDANIIPGYLKIEGVHARLDALDDAGMIYWSKGGKGFPYLKQYLESSKGSLPQNLITHINAETKGKYPTQKPLKLYELFIKASSNPEDIVLDPFAGSGTTLHAAENLGRKWVGIDIWNPSPKCVEERMNEVTGIDRVYIETVEGVPKEIVSKKKDPMPYLIPKDYSIMKMSSKEAREKLLPSIESIGGKFCCPGCGEDLSERYFVSDHETPQSEYEKNQISKDFILNLIPLCGPCNSLKGSDLTMKGLWKELKKRKKMVDFAKAREALKKVIDSRERIHHTLLNKLIGRN